MDVTVTQLEGEEALQVIKGLGVAGASSMVARSRPLRLAGREEGVNCVVT